MCYLSNINSTSGDFQLSFKLLSLHFHQRFNLFSRAIETFQSLGLITINGDGVGTVTSWNKRQFKSDNVYERVKKFREVTQKRNVSCNDIETAPDTDTDTDKRKKIKKEKYTDDFLSFWNHYPKKVGKDAAWKCWQLRNRDRPDITPLITSI